MYLHTLLKFSSSKDSFRDGLLQQEKDWILCNQVYLFDYKRCFGHMFCIVSCFLHSLVDWFELLQVDSLFGPKWILFMPLRFSGWLNGLIATPGEVPIKLALPVHLGFLSLRNCVENTEKQTAQKAASKE